MMMEEYTQRNLESAPSDVAQLISQTFVFRVLIFYTIYIFLRGNIAKVNLLASAGRLSVAEVKVTQVLLINAAPTFSTQDA